jgi:hypothetical protein
MGRCEGNAPDEADQPMHWRRAHDGFDAGRSPRHDAGQGAGRACELGEQVREDAKLLVFVDQ